MLQTKNYIVSQKTVTIEPTKLDLVRILKADLSKPNHMFFYLAVWMTFSLKIEPVCTPITPNRSLTLFFML